MITEGPRRASARRIARSITCGSCAGLRDLLNIFGDVGEHAVEVQLLLVAAAAHGRFGLAADGEHRHVVELGVVEAGDQVGGARTAGREADAELAGEFCMRDGHEGAHFLVARLDEVDLAVALKGADHAVDAVAGIAVDPFDAPGLQSFDEEVRCLHGCTRHFRECEDNAVSRRMLLELFARRSRAPLAKPSRGAPVAEW